MVAPNSDPPRRAATSLGIAALAAGSILLAAPPAGLWPLAFVGAAAMYWLAQSRARGVVAAAWLGGVIVNAVGCAWAVEVLRRFAGVDAGSGTALLLAMACYQATVPTLAVLMCQRLHRAGVPPLWAAPLCLALAESVVPFLFPWYLAIAIAPAWPLTQVAELGGPPAVSALLLLWGGVLVEGARAVRRGHAPRQLWLGAAIATGLVLVGLARAGHVAALRAEAPTLRTAIVQPHFGRVPLARREREGAELVSALRAATERAGELGATLAVWPESAFPFVADRAATHAFPSGHPWDVRGSYRGALVFGALTHPFGQAHVYNSAVAIGADGAVRGRYDKVHLVAFGEYVPLADRFARWAERVRARTPEWPAIAAGDGPRALVDGELRLGALICYEDLLPRYVAEHVRATDPTLLVTVANHAWFGTSAAPAQALALAHFRSIETRRDLLRATATGVSSFGDALGRVRARGPLIDPDAPPAAPPHLLLVDARPSRTFALGPWAVPAFPWACALLLAVAWWRARKRAART